MLGGQPAEHLEHVGAQRHDVLRAGLRVLASESERAGREVDVTPHGADELAPTRADQQEGAQQGLPRKAP